MSQHSDPRHIANWLRERVTGELQCDSRRVAAHFENLQPKAVRVAQ